MDSINRKFNRIITKYVVISIFLVVSLMATSADARDVRVIEREFDKVFLQMLDDPSDIDITLRYAELAIKLEDYESAIPAMERILIFNPELVDIKLELGVLYYRLESYDTAKEYFNKVNKDKKASVELREKASNYLKKLRN